MSTYQYTAAPAMTMWQLQIYLGIFNTTLCLGKLSLFFIVASAWQCISIAGDSVAHGSIENLIELKKTQKCVVHRCITFIL